MVLEKVDPLLKVIPSIKKPDTPLSLKQKFRWTAMVMAVYFLLFSIPASGTNVTALQSPQIQLISIIFAARIGSLITVGIGPIVLASLILQLVIGSGVIKVDLNDPEQKSRYQGIQKIAALAIAVVESYIFVLTGYVPILNQGAFGLVVVQLALGAVSVIFLDEMMTKWGVTSGLNLFIAGGVAYSIIAGTTTVIVPEAIAAITGGGAAAIPNAILAFGPLVFSAVVFLVSIYVYDIKVELPLVFSQFRGVGGRLPIPLLYASVLPVILATSFEASLVVWLRVLAGVTGSLAPLAKFVALYQPQAVATAAGTTSTNLVLNGGILYLVSPYFPLPYDAAHGGVGGYSTYVSYLATHTTQLYLPSGAILNVPEWIHIILYTLVLTALCVVFGNFWIEMTGQSPKHVAEQLEEVGWQIPGFRRDPRIIESVLNKYIPTITVMGSIFVGLLAAVATLTGAVGTGVGILLTVGIMYMLYQQLQQENLLSSYPTLNKLIS